MPGSTRRYTHDPAKRRADEGIGPYAFLSHSFHHSRFFRLLFAGFTFIMESLCENDRALPRRWSIDMKRTYRNRLLTALLLLCAVFALGGCRAVMDRLPPLPTPSNGEPVPEPFAADLLPTTEPPLVATPAPTPVPTLPPTPSPTPTPAPTPKPEDPNTPHLYIRDATYPESMGQGGIAVLLGEIYTDKGVIAQVRGRIVDADGNNVQQCLYYPYDSTFSLAGTVNAELVFGLLEPGHYSYIVSAIAENNSYTNGEETLIDHPFEIYYP